MAEGAGDGAAKEDRAIQDRAKDLGGKDHGGEEGGSIEDGPDTPSPSFAPTPALTPAPNPARPLAPDHGPASAGADPFGKLSAVLEQGRLDWQLGQAEKALAEQPDDPRRLAVLGEVLTRLGDLDRARACFTRQAELDHGSAAALNNLGGLAMRAGDSREACGLFDAALAIDPDNADARFNR
ncbi:MAG: tetratricopeptide repeat protein, partial [Rhodospirillaceae bacterium]